MTWWSPRKPFLHDWLRRRKAQRHSRPALSPKAAQPHRRSQASKRRPHRNAGKPGRPPHPSTIALRQRLQEDHDAGRLQTPTHYVQWLTTTYPKRSKASATTAVHRELKAFRFTADTHVRLPAAPIRLVR